LALLLGPQTGAETRGQIKDKSVELKDGTVEGLTETEHGISSTLLPVSVWSEEKNGRETSLHT